MDIACSGHCIALEKETMKLKNCNIINSCNQCYFKTDSKRCELNCQEWCDSEYVEPHIDWSKVPVDTPILVRDYEDNQWLHRHFAEYKNGFVYAWTDDYTSWSAKDTPRNAIPWIHAELPEDGE